MFLHGISRSASYATLIINFVLTATNDKCIHVCAAYVLCHQVGFAAAIAGVGTTLALIPIQIWLGQFFARNRSNTAKLTDERVRVMGEVLSSIASVKAFVWEKPFSARNAAVREK